MLISLQNSIAGCVGVSTDIEGGYVVFVGEAAGRAATNAEIFAATKRFRISQIDVLRNSKKSAGINYSWPDDLEGVIQTRDQTDLLNISGQVTEAILLKSQGVTAPVLWFIDEANVQHPLTPDEAIIMGMAVQGGIAALVSHARELKNAVSELPTLAEVNAFDITQGW